MVLERVSKGIKLFDVKLIAEGKERFKDLYSKSKEERQKLRETDGYRQALLDLWEIVATSVIYPHGECLLGKAVIKIASGEIKIEKNIDDE